MRLPSPIVCSTSVLMLAAVAITGCGGTASSPAATVTASSTLSPSPTTSTAAPTPTTTTPSAPPPAPVTTSSATGKTIGSIEQMPGWSSCDLCSGGGSIAYSMTQGLSYPQPGSAKFSLGQGAAWGHALWWERLGNDPTPSHFVLTLDQYFENPSVSWATEYNVNQIIDGGWYNFAVQCSFGYGIWQLWDPANQHWVPTSVPCTRPAPSSHVQVRLEFARTNGQAVFVSIGIDGNVHPLNMAFNPLPINGANGDFGVSFQLDANANPDPYSAWVHNLALNYW